MCVCAHGSRAFGGQKRVLGALEPPDVSATTGNQVFCKSSTHWRHHFGLKICFLNVFNVYFYFIYLGACTCGGQKTICGDQFSPSTRVPGTKPGSSGLAAVTFPHLARLASPMTCFVTPTPLQHCSLADGQLLPPLRHPMRAVGSWNALARVILSHVGQPLLFALGGTAQVKSNFKAYFGAALFRLGVKMLSPNTKSLVFKTKTKFYQ